MYPRLITVCVVSLAALSGCKHRDSFTNFGAPSASVQPIASIETAERSNPLGRLVDTLFGARQTPVEITDPTTDDEDPIQYVDPVTPAYQQSYSPAYKTAAVEQTPQYQDNHPDATEQIETLPAYTLDFGDRIRVFVFDQPNLSRVYNVDSQGRISVPLIGSVLARGRTTRTLEGIIKRGLERKFVKDAKVSIEIAVYRPFFIHGEVRTPGQFPYVYGMTVEAAVATAGGFSPRAKKTGIKIVRTVDGSRDMIITDPSAFVRPGDIISVDERFF